MERFLSFTLKAALVLVGAVFVLFGNVYAEPISDLKPYNYVNDFAQVIDAETESSINSKLSDLEKQTGNQITVVTIKSMDGDYIEHYAVKLFEVWKVGNEKLNNGALLLVAVNDRQMRIEVGYGLESLLTDGRSSYIIQNILRPSFRQGDYGGGIDKAIDSIGEILNGTSNDLQNLKDSDDSSSSLWSVLFNLIPLIFFFAFAFFEWLAAVLGRTKSWWLGGILGAVVGGIIILFVGVSLFTEIVTTVLVLAGFLFDYFVSKNYKQHKAGILQGPPDWWSGSTWGPGSSTWTGSSGSSWGGFGGGSSGGGGASGDW